ncbi:efflux RND transporter permease subunit [Telmatocola sphagniphila]|uniref:Efflux RND transporter permease subunit n=1 Tax=Telmatocola sphagniphila TaxID=1123043 RepID=A0A8E6ETC4_9BACT|nr:efflux RND transporter permease subunit [Telmatocola sphagniphila]QVL32269.1 efflux RND transporter permease subunit [Telmatocola sphagniphila]
MTISDLCIKRPVFTWVLVTIPVVLGIVSYSKLGVDLFPKFDFPAVGIICNLPGSSAEEMESTVTKPVEEVLNAISGVKEMVSVTKEGLSQVTVLFVLEKDSNIAAQEVREKIASLTNGFPKGMDPPLIQKFEIDAAPIITLAVSGRRDVREVTEIAKHRVQEQLQTISGVGAVFLSGGKSRAINVIVNPDSLVSYGLSIEDVRQALLTQNVEVPGGIVQQGPRELILRTLGRVAKAEQFNDVIVTYRKGFPIRIRDIGRAEDTFEEQRGLARMDGQNAVALYIQKQSGTNTIAISDAVAERLEEIRKTLPPDIKIENIQDQSRFVRNSMSEVKKHLLLAGLLVSLTILLFIHDWRTTLIATLAIPTSIVPTFLFMYVMGFTLNNITMLGLILAIGIVIDDAVVVHENIFRFMEEKGMGAMEAAREGTREISLAVLATSLSLLVIFLPIAFMGGIVGRFFSSFGLTVAFAIVMSLFVSFTLTPMLCSRFLKLSHSNQSTAHSKSGWVWRLIEAVTGRSLAWSLRHRWIMVIISILVFFSTIPIASGMGFNLVPRDDTSEFQVSFVTPVGYSLDRVDQVVTEIENRLIQLPGVVHRFTSIGRNSDGGGKGQGDVTRGSIYFRMKELSERNYSQFDVQERARKILKEYPDLRCSVSDVSAFEGNGQDTRTFQVVLLGPELTKLEKYSEELVLKLRKIPGLSDVDTTMLNRKDEVQVAIDNDRASDLGIPVQTIANTLNVLIGGQIISRYKEGIEQYDVWLRADKDFRANPQTIGALTIPSPNAGPVQLSNLARTIEDRGPSQIDRYNRQRSVTILANPEGIPLNEAVTRARKILDEMEIPPEYKIDFKGQAETLGETGYYFIVAFVLSILFMYLILAAQFESWFQPLSILAPLPVTIPFGLISLVLFRSSMDLYAMFGLFMLIGIVKKNGILQIDKTNQLREAGVERDEALREANHTRLRPILMTTMMLMAAMVPIALGQGPGAGERASMAKVIIGGQLLSLFLALLVTPVVYSLVDGMWSWVRRKVGGANKISNW